MLKTSDGYKVGVNDSVWVAVYNCFRGFYYASTLKAHLAMERGFDFYMTAEAALAEAKRLNEL